MVTKVDGATDEWLSVASDWDGTEEVEGLYHVGLRQVVVIFIVFVPHEVVETHEVIEEIEAVLFFLKYLDVYIIEAQWL